VKVIFVKINIIVLMIVYLACDYTYKKSESYNLEKHRQLALNEWKKSEFYNSAYDSIFSIKYYIDDSTKIDQNILKYIKKNPFLPDYIKKYLVEKKEIFMMSLGEFYLINPQYSESTIITQPLGRENYLQIGYPLDINKQKRSITNGPIWWFKYYFLWDFGIASN
jgi:hypothetical protein